MSVSSIKTDIANEIPVAASSLFTATAPANLNAVAGLLNNIISLCEDLSDLYRSQDLFNDSTSGVGKGKFYKESAQTVTDLKTSLAAVLADIHAKAQNP